MNTTSDPMMTAGSLFGGLACVLFGTGVIVGDLWISWWLFQGAMVLMFLGGVSAAASIAAAAIGIASMAVPVTLFGLLLIWRGIQIFQSHCWVESAQQNCGRDAGLARAYAAPQNLGNSSSERAPHAIGAALEAVAIGACSLISIGFVLVIVLLWVQG